MHHDGVRLRQRSPVREVDSFSGATRTPELLALNPAGQVPVVVLDAYERAKMFEWLFWEQYSHEPAIAVRIARLYYLKTPEYELDPLVGAPEIIGDPFDFETIAALRTAMNCDSHCRTIAVHHMAQNR